MKRRTLKRRTLKRLVGTLTVSWLATVGIHVFATASALPTTAEPAPEWMLEDDLFRRTASKALAGEFGELKPWQKRGYELGLKQGVTVEGMAWATTYYPQEGFYRGKACTSGWPVDERCAAVRRADWHKLQYHYVWTNEWGIRQILDTGSNRNRARAIKNGAERWLDYWMPVPTEAVTTQYAFIMEAK